MNHQDDIGIIGRAQHVRRAFVQGINKVSDMKRPKVTFVTSKRKKLSISLQMRADFLLGGPGADAVGSLAMAPSKPCEASNAGTLGSVDAASSFAMPPSRPGKASSGGRLGGAGVVDGNRPNELGKLGGGVTQAGAGMFSGREWVGSLKDRRVPGHCAGAARRNERPGEPLCVRQIGMSARNSPRTLQWRPM